MMENSKYFLPIAVILAIVWFIITWSYISLDIYDVSQLWAWEYKILGFREKFIELALIFGLFAFGFCIGSTFFWAKESFDTYGFTPQVAGKDNLKLIEWIGPKIEILLREWGIETFHKLSQSSEKELLKILERGWSNYALANPKNWREQAELAHHNKWRELKEYQDFLRNGI